MDFPRSQTKQAQTSTEWQLKAALPAGNWVFAAAESLLLLQPQSVHETNSFESQLLVLFKQLALFCSCPSLSILWSLRRQKQQKKKNLLINGQLEKSRLLTAVQVKKHDHLCF